MHELSRSGRRGRLTHLNRARLAIVEASPAKSGIEGDGRVIVGQRLSGKDGVVV